MTQQITAPDMFQYAIYEALVAAGGVLAEIRNCSDADVLSAPLGRRARELETEIENRTIFGKYSIDDFRNFAEDLGKPIDRETQTGFVADEYDMSGGHVETHVSDHGIQLVGLRSALQLLIRRLEDAEYRLAAEQISEELRA